MEDRLEAVNFERWKAWSGQQQPHQIIFKNLQQPAATKLVGNITSVFLSTCGWEGHKTSFFFWDVHTMWRTSNISSLGSHSSHSPPNQLPRQQQQQGGAGRADNHQHFHKKMYSHGALHSDMHANILTSSSMHATITCRSSNMHATTSYLPLLHANSPTQHTTIHASSCTTLLQHAHKFLYIKAFLFAAITRSGLNTTVGTIDSAARVYSRPQVTIALDLPANHLH